jgi:rhamnose transport system substrate-binding protein
MKKLSIAALAAMLALGVAMPAWAQAITPEKGKKADLVLLPKFLGIMVFDQANEGAQEAHKELGNTGELLFLGPTPENSVAGQIEIMTTATTQGKNGVMLSNNAGDQITPSAEAAQKAGTKVVTWDSPIPSGKGESVFVAQVDFGSIGTVMADMAHSILGGKGEMAVLSASPDAANQNSWIASMKEALKGDKYKDIKLVDVVYGDDQSEVSYNRALALVDKYPNLGLIMSPTTVGIQATAKAMQDEGLCDKVKVSGLGLPSEMVSYTKNGCAPEFALWDFRDLGYLTYYTTYLLATGQLKGEVGEAFAAGRMGEFKIEQDPGREGGKRILMGPFTIYNKDNVEAAAK